MAKIKREPKKQKASRDTNIEDRIHKNIFTNFEINQEFELNNTHKSFIKLALDKDTKVSIIDGPAGSGKTYLSVLAALNCLKHNHVEEIFYVRSIVESASKSLGSLPGEADEKFLPWMYPLFDKLQELLIEPVAKNLISQDLIRGIPVNFVRGATFRNSCVIVDEAQNLTLPELITILTRIGKNCKYFIIGDTKQSDIGNKSGFESIFNLFNNYISETKGIHTHEFTSVDVVRSEILKFIVEKLEELHMKA
tara:strand:- start:44 stop:796 length:753 start_codon:yes stop_codon:yes gene_type:complete